MRKGLDEGVRRFAEMGCRWVRLVSDRETGILQDVMIDMDEEHTMTNRNTSDSSTMQYCTRQFTTFDATGTQNNAAQYNFEHDITIQYSNARDTTSYHGTR